MLFRSSYRSNDPFIASYRNYVPNILTTVDDDGVSWVRKWRRSCVAARDRYGDSALVTAIVTDVFSYGVVDAVSSVVNISSASLGRISITSAVSTASTSWIVGSCATSHVSECMVAIVVS